MCLWWWWWWAGRWLALKRPRPQWICSHILSLIVIKYPNQSIMDHCDQYPMLCGLLSSIMDSMKMKFTGLDNIMNARNCENDECLVCHVESRSSVPWLSWSKWIISKATMLWMFYKSFCGEVVLWSVAVRSKRCGDLDHCRPCNISSEMRKKSANIIMNYHHCGSLTLNAIFMFRFAKHEIIHILAEHPSHILCSIPIKNLFSVKSIVGKKLKGCPNQDCHYHWFVPW